MTNTGRDDVATTMAIGVMASVAQFLAHEGLGHGSVCRLLGGRVIALAPLWMRCSVSSSAVGAAGPLTNILAGLVCFAILRWWMPADARLRMFLWLSVAFQWLVAAGYLGVGAVTRFGDWGVLLPGVLGSWSGRLLFLALAAGCYGLVLRGQAHAAVRAFGASALEGARLSRLTLLPASAAAAVALGAELVGHRIQPLGLGLAAGCTLVVGWSLLTLPRFALRRSPEAGPEARIDRSEAWIVAGALVAVGFLIAVGPGRMSGA